jgi:adenylosuccinate synthase
VGYELNGRQLKSFPTDLKRLYDVKPIYETLSGWNENIEDRKSYKDLPEKTRDYLSFLSNQTGMQIEIISVGPKRKQTFFVNR